MLPWYYSASEKTEIIKAYEKGALMGLITIMPCLDMKEGRVVKGVHFVDLKDAGDPVENAEFYQREGADEVAMLFEGEIIWRGKASDVDNSGNPYVDQFVHGRADGPIQPAL